jgi:hypothetical protein
MFLTEQDYKLVSRVRYLVNKGLEVNFGKMKRFVQLAKQMKDEKNKDIQDKVEEKKSNNVLQNKISFLEDMTNTPRNNYFGIGLSLKINFFVIILIFLFLLKLYLINKNSFIIASSTIFVIAMTGIAYSVIKNRKMLITKIGMISQNSIIKLYHLNNNWKNKILPISFQPNYKKLYLQTVAETTMVKKLEEKLIDKKENNKFAEMMEQTNKITTCIRMIYNIVKVMIIIVIAWWIFSKASQLQENIVYAKNKVMKVANNLRNLEKMINYEENLKKVLEKMNDNMEQMNKMKKELGIAIEHVITKSKNKMNEAGKAIVDAFTETANKTIEMKEEMGKTMEHVFTKQKQNVGKVFDNTFTKIKEYKNILGNRMHSLTNELTSKSHTH